MKPAAVTCGFLLVACSFQLPSPQPGSGDAQIVDDSHDDFAAGACSECVATPWNTIEPAAFVLGGLHARGYLGAVIADADSYDDVVAKLPALAGESYRQLPANFRGVDRPRGLGLAGNTDYTVLYDGEILLPGGTSTLELDADDHAIVQVALDGHTFGPPLLTVNRIASQPLAVARAGWYPIRVAYAQNGGDSRFLLSLIESDTTRRAIDATRLRARVTDAPGVIAFGFDGQAFATARGETALAGPASAFGIGAPPFDLAMRSDFFSLRYAGQLRVDAEGDYELAVDIGSDADDGFRLWIDHDIVASYWAGLPDQRTVTMHLAAGWHDLIVDYSEARGNAQLAVTLAGAPIDPAHLRPAIAGGLLATFADTQTIQTIPDNSQLVIDLPIDGGDQMLIDAVDYGFRIANQDMATLDVDLFDCGLVAQRLTTAAQPQTFYYSADKRCIGKKPSPTWKLRFADTAFGNGPFIGLGTVTDYGLGVTFHGGDRMPFAPQLTYISAPKPAPGLTRVQRVTVDGALAGASYNVSVRAADDETALAAAPWQPIGNAPIALAGELVQYEIDVAGDGWIYPAIDKVTIDYSTRP